MLKDAVSFFNTYRSPKGLTRDKFIRVLSQFALDHKGQLDVKEIIALKKQTGLDVSYFAGRQGDSNPCQEGIYQDYNCNFRDMKDEDLTNIYGDIEGIAYKIFGDQKIVNKTGFTSAANKPSKLKNYYTVMRVHNN
jgi:hypothetical protein